MPTLLDKKNVAMLELSPKNLKKWTKKQKIFPIIKKFFLIGDN